MRNKKTPWSVLIIALLLTPVLVLAANNPGHDTLYIEQYGDSEINGTLNLTNQFKIGNLFYSAYLDILGNGSQPVNSYSQIYSTTTNLVLNAPSGLILLRDAGSMVYVGTSSVDLNVSRNAFVYGGLNVTSNLWSGGFANISGNIHVGGSGYVAGSQICTVGNALCSAVGGNGNVSSTGSAGYIPQFQSGTILNNSAIYQLGNNIGIGTQSPSSKVEILTNADEIVNLTIGTSSGGGGNGGGLRFKGAGGAIINTISGIQGTMNFGILSFTYPVMSLTGSTLTLNPSHDTNDYAIVYNKNSANAARIHHTGAYNTGILELETYSGSWAETGLTITQNKVGISTSSPTGTLEVNGTLNVTQNITINGIGYIAGSQICTAANGACGAGSTSDNTTQANQIRRLNDTTLIINTTLFNYVGSTAGLLQTNISTKGNTSSAGTAGYIPQFQSNTLLNNSIIYQSGMGITARIGIGTNSPKGTLHIAGSETSTGTNASLTINNLATGGRNWTIRTGADGTWTPTGGMSIADDFNIRLSIDGNGNVGIGNENINPTAKLEIRGAASNGISLNVNNTLYVNGSSQRVGIGTLTPTATLEVNGTIRSTNSIVGDTSATLKLNISSNSNNILFTTTLPILMNNSLRSTGNINVSSGNDICIEGTNKCLSTAGTGGGFTNGSDIDVRNINITGRVVSSLNISSRLFVGQSNFGNTTAVAVFADGIGKIDVGVIDPVYNINGSKYATYMAAMIGMKEETTGMLKLDCVDLICSKTIDFNKQEQGSDLWLFSKTTNLKNNLDKTVVILTPSFNGKIWYNKNKTENKITIFATLENEYDEAEVSYRLSAPRFDFEQWKNHIPESTTGGYTIND